MRLFRGPTGFCSTTFLPEDLAARLGKPVHPSGRTTADFFTLLFGEL